MKHTQRSTTSLLRTLRALVPQQVPSLAAAKRVAELQAERLRRTLRVDAGPISDELLLDLPRITVEYVDDMPTSGCSFWDSQRKMWMVQINASEPATRQRFSVCHELKHIVDHGRTNLLYGQSAEAEVHAEQVADFFAGCLLMPRSLVKRAWAQGVRSVEALADWFDVSPAAIEVRLAQIGLDREPPRREVAHRAAPATRLGRHGYFRVLHADFQGSAG